MDDFVRGKLTEWGLSDSIDRFKEQGIDEESLYCLKDKEDIEKLFSEVGPKLKFKKRLEQLQRQQDHDDSDDSAQERPSTSGAAKRKLDLQGESNEGQPPAKQQHEAIPGQSSDEQVNILYVKKIMQGILAKLQNQQPTKLNDFLKTKIEELKIDKRELVGVFGKTGAGKSSLINAVLGEKNLLPSGSLKACTSVMIKVEATHNSKYEAEIEFITKEEWSTELWSMCHFISNVDRNCEQKKDTAATATDEYRDIKDKMSALYGEDWKQKIISHENLMHNKYFKEIQEFLDSNMKTLKADTAKELSAKFARFTRTHSKQGGSKEERWYWPLVKCVTVKVPNNDFLQHVTLVDLPGSGDRNKSRDEMWKRFVGDCSVVWIVTDIERAASAKEPWEILDETASLIGNGGQCQYIHFICTKSDCIHEEDDSSTVQSRIKTRNEEAKTEVDLEFQNQNHINKHYSKNTFKVFTVSSTEFLQQKHLKPEDTEIPNLQEFLKDLNDSYSDTFNYVSGAHGILSLIQGAAVVHNKNTEVCAELENNLKQQLCKVRKVMEETYQTFEKCLNVGVERSKSSCEKELKSLLNPSEDGRGFHRTLKCIVEKGGIHKPKNERLIDVNMKLSSYLTGSIDEEFRKTFPQKTEGKCGPFKGVVNSFSLDTEKLIKKYKDVELQLTFLKSEEDMMKTKLNRIIQDCKKIIYWSLTETIEKTMKTGYDRAATFTGDGSLENMRDTLEKHVHDSKDIMFDQAKNTMLKKLKGLQTNEILEKLEKTMMESIELSLKTNDHSIPDVKREYKVVKKYYNELCTLMKGT